MTTELGEADVQGFDEFDDKEMQSCARAFRYSYSHYSDTEDEFREFNPTRYMASPDSDPDATNESEDRSNDTSDTATTASNDAPDSDEPEVNESPEE